MMRTIHAILMKPLLGLLLVLLLLVPYSKPISLVGSSSSSLTLAIDVVGRVITVFVRTLRETTFGFRWTALTIVRHVAPAADASLTSRFITFVAWSVAMFVACPGAAAFTVAAVAASAVAVVVVTAAPGLVTVAAARAFPGAAGFTVAAVAASAVAVVVVTAAPGLVTVAAARAFPGAAAFTVAAVAASAVAVVVVTAAPGLVTVAAPAATALAVASR